MTEDDVIDTWMMAGEERWFAKDPAFDGALSVRFRSALADARSGAFDHWARTPRGALGLVILLDQFSRNIHRGSPLAFAADARALRLAKDVVAKGFDYAFPAPVAMWFYLPFEHVEEIESQMRCIGLFTKRGPPEMIYWVKLHHDIIARFGRFPHRNRILGRQSTPDEIAFLAAGGFAG